VTFDDGGVILDGRISLSTTNSAGADPAGFTNSTLRLTNTQVIVGGDVLVAQQSSAAPIEATSARVETNLAAATLCLGAHQIKHSALSRAFLCSGRLVIGFVVALLAVAVKFRPSAIGAQISRVAPTFGRGCATIEDVSHGRMPVRRSRVREAMRPKVSQWGRSFKPSGS
jgi:hypothetical protein